MVNFWAILKNNTLQIKTTLPNFEGFLGKNWLPSYVSIWSHWNSHGNKVI